MGTGKKGKQIIQRDGKRGEQQLDLYLVHRSNRNRTRRLQHKLVNLASVVEHSSTGNPIHFLCFYN